MPFTYEDSNLDWHNKMAQQRQFQQQQRQQNQGESPFAQAMGLLAAGAGAVALMRGKPSTNKILDEVGLGGPTPKATETPNTPKPETTQAINDAHEQVKTKLLDNVEAPLNPAKDSVDKPVVSSVDELLNKPTRDVNFGDWVERIVVSQQQWTDKLYGQVDEFVDANPVLNYKRNEYKGNVRGVVDRLFGNQEHKLLETNSNEVLEKFWNLLQKRMDNYTVGVGEELKIHAEMHRNHHRNKTAGPELPIGASSDISHIYKGMSSPWSPPVKEPVFATKPYKPIDSQYIGLYDMIDELPDVLKEAAQKEMVKNSTPGAQSPLPTFFDYNPEKNTVKARLYRGAKKNEPVRDLSWWSTDPKYSEGYGDEMQHRIVEMPVSGIRYDKDGTTIKFDVNSPYLVNKSQAEELNRDGQVIPTAKTFGVGQTHDNTYVHADNYQTFNQYMGSTLTGNKANNSNFLNFSLGQEFLEANTLASGIVK